jgi:RNA polymerase sigma-70 factor, ECF subfamily
MEPKRLDAVELTRMLKAWSSGDASALDRLTPVVYAELHCLARRNLAGEREGHLLQPSALVNEAFLRLIGDARVEWANRAHFFAFSARLMRQILIDFARAQDTGNAAAAAPI